MIQSRSSRNYGIDLLRTASMFMVLILHILSPGGILGQLKPMSGSFIAAWTLECLSYCAVNCYAMISGYVGTGSTYRYSQLATLWLQVVLYVLLGNLALALLEPGSVGLKTILKSFFPILQNHYWYFTAYALMFLFVPLLNRIVASLDRKQAAVLCGTIFVVFSILPTYRRVDDVFHLGAGYSILWLSLLYVIGGCVKKHRFLHHIPDGLLALGILLCIAVMMASKLFITSTSLSVIRDNISSDILISYPAPTVVTMALLLLVLCGKHPHLPGWAEKALSVLAPASFSVYNIHAHPSLCPRFFKGAFKSYAFFPTVGLITAVFLTAIAVFGVCILIDTLRQRLFKALAIRRRLQTLEEKWIGGLWDNTDIPQERGGRD